MRLQKYETGIIRGVEKSCKICGKVFNIFTQQHQCKRCFRAVCAGCGATKREVFKDNHTRRAHRTCTICLEDSRFIQDYIKTNKLVFGSTCDLGRRWLSRLLQAKQEAKEESKEESKEYLRKQTYESFWQSLNYSLREFVGLVVPADAYAMVNRVYCEVMIRHPSCKPQHMIYVIVFLLCFLTAESAVLVCCYLLKLKDRILDPQAVLREYLQTLSVGRVNHKLYSFVQKYSINHLIVESSIYVVNKIIEKGKVEEGIAFYAGVLDTNKIELKGVRENGALSDLIVLRNCGVENASIKSKMLSNVDVKKYLKHQTNQKKQVPQNIIQINSKNQKKQVPQNIILANNLPNTNSYTNNNKINTYIHGTYNTTNNDTYAKNIQALHKQLRQKIEGRVKGQKSREESIDSRESKEKSVPFVVRDFGQDNEEKNEMINIEKRAESFVQDSFSIMSLMDQPQYSKKNNLNNSDRALHTQQTFRKKQYCAQCSKMEDQLQKLKASLTLKQNIIERLQNKYKNSQNDSFTNSSQTFQQQYEIKITSLKSQCYEIERENERIKKQNMDLKQSLLKMEIELDIKKREITQMSLSVEMMKNKLQTRRIEQVNNIPAQNKREQQLLRMNQMLKSSLLQKNMQLQMCYKQNKLLSYQIEDESSKGQLQALQSKIQMMSKQKGDLMEKLKELSVHLLAEEEQKLFLSSQNFALKLILQEHKISYCLQ